MIDGSRRKRIARGSGTSVEDVNRLLKQFDADAEDAEDRSAGMGGRRHGSDAKPWHAGRMGPGALKGRGHAARKRKGVTMLAIRLTRTGSKKQAHYRVVVCRGAQAPRDSRVVEVVGHYNPRTEPATVTVDRERIDALAEGRRAARRDTVQTLLASHVTRSRRPTRAAAAPQAGAQ